MNKEINSFEYFEEMTADWNRVDLLRRCYDLCNEMVEKKQEIERLQNKVEELMELYTTERHCKDDYKSIIKEVREYIDKGLYCEYGDFAYKVQKELLEMLDKEEQ